MNKMDDHSTSGTSVLIVGAVFFLIGFTGNVLVVIVYSISPLLKKAHNIFVVNIAVIDLIILFSTSPVVLAIQFGDEDRLSRNNHALCTTFGVVSSSVFCVNAFAMATVAMNR